MSAAPSNNQICSWNVPLSALQVLLCCFSLLTSIDPKQGSTTWGKIIYNIICHGCMHLAVCVFPRWVWCATHTSGSTLSSVPLNVQTLLMGVDTQRLNLQILSFATLKKGLIKGSGPPLIDSRCVQLKVEFKIQPNEKTHNLIMLRERK